MIQIFSTIPRLLLTALWCVGGVTALSKTTDVNCTRTETISDTLSKGDPGDLIRVSGACNEKLVIRVDRVVLEGVSGATIQGGGSIVQGTELDGLVTVDGARGVVIRNLVINRSRAEGVYGTRGASFTLENVTLQDNAGAGLGATASIIDITNCTSRRNWAGFDLSTGTHVVLRGNIITSDNQNSGIFVGGASSLEVRGAKIEANNNMGGVVALAGSQISFWRFNGTQTTGGAITASNNRGAGIRLIDSGMEIFSDAATITASGNAVGLALNAGLLSSGPPANDVRVVLENNGIGLDAEGRSIGVVIGGLSVRGNTTTGVVADDSSLILVSLPPNPTVVSSNAVDLDARFGSRLTVDGLAFATKKCEPNVLARGVPGCP